MFVCFFPQIFTQLALDIIAVLCMSRFLAFHMPACASAGFAWCFLSDTERGRCRDASPASCRLAGGRRARALRSFAGRRVVRAPPALCWREVAWCEPCDPSQDVAWCEPCQPCAGGRSPGASPARPRRQEDASFEPRGEGRRRDREGRSRGRERRCRDREGGQGDAETGEAQRQGGRCRDREGGAETVREAQFLPLNQQLVPPPSGGADPCSRAKQLPVQISAPV